MSRGAEAAIGVFGKLPARGDFIDRGLPKTFTEPWHAWLTTGLLAARAELGPRFELCYMQAPVWRFALPAGVAGPQAAIGVFSPSVDQVGREFPLTLAAVADRVPDLVDRLDDEALWLSGLEELARETLVEPFELEPWLRELAGFAVGDPGEPLDPLAEVWRFTCTPDAAAPCLLDMLTRLASASTVCFWSEGSPFVPAGGWLGRSLPRADDFVTLLSDGRASPPEARG